MKSSTNKKKIITSFSKLTQEQRLFFTEAYPDGYTAHIQKITKPSGDIIYVVPLETEDSIYMVKMDVKVDQKLTEEEFDKEIFSTKNSPDVSDLESNEDDEEKESKDTFVLIHGNSPDKDIEEDDDDDEDDEDEDDEDFEDDEETDIK